MLPPGIACLEVVNRRHHDVEGGAHAFRVRFTCDPAPNRTNAARIDSRNFPRQIRGCWLVIPQFCKPSSLFSMAMDCMLGGRGGEKKF